jgi:hypothetical protein
MALEKIDCLENAACDQSCILLGVLFDVSANVYQVAQHPAGPYDHHRGVLVSLGFPQDFSHFTTFSWPTSRSESNSAMPA